MNISIKTTLYPQDPPEIVTVTFELIHPNAKAPTRASAGAAGWDLCITECTQAGDYRGEASFLHTGIRLAIPSGYEGQIRPRSSLARDGLVILNSPGTIDSDYRGEIKILVATHTVPGYLKVGDRVAQLIIAPIPKVRFVKGCVEINTERGEGGFGSTGK